MILNVEKYNQILQSWFDGCIQEALIYLGLFLCILYKYGQ